MNLKSTPNNAPKETPNTNNQENNSNLSLAEGFFATLSQRFKGRTFLMVEMSKIFLQQAPFVKKILEECPLKKDFEAIRFEAHKFKSTVNIMGLEQLREYASETEKLYHEGEPNIDTSELLGNFVKQIDIDIVNVKNAILRIETGN